MALKLARTFHRIDNTMRILPLLLLTWSVIATDAQAQTAKESQDAAVAAIKRLGGTVDNPGNPLAVILRGSKVTDAGLVHLKGLTSLQSLYLQGSKVTAAGVKDLQAALPKCKILK
jgi:hypothetical protein